MIMISLYKLSVCFIFPYACSYILILHCMSACYVDPDVRLGRRIKRDTVERGRDVHSVLEQA
jgi:uridine kinase